MMNKQAFTIMEVVIVCIIIGVLAASTSGVYIRQAERAKGNKALLNLQIMRDAQAMYMLDNSVYTNNVPTLQGYVNFFVNDGDWAYTIPVGVDDTFTVRAERQAGFCANALIEIKQDGKVYYDNDPFGSYPP